MVDADRIREEGVKLLDEFSEKLRDVPETGETHYVVDLKNVWRPDARPERCEGFREKLGKLAPKFEKGYVVAEKGE
ncbi:MAG: Asp-tRNA(Asn) amidotransferase GatCAB subunit C [Candidatus Altiarchaeales archaeon]|nr:Asp-tRNA(Asn) amidotransferase GatCAB subunit C [Candidatus Altiarchaeales archaeon]MBD3415948.1 Asp-tRNA(Asn) amidotransferase GatCAB subunit C [Candidatus Altiarchaeales archaeon]